jgi:hypothetical protein
MDRNSPLTVVIPDVQRVAGTPRASIFTRNHGRSFSEDKVMKETRKNEQMASAPGGLDEKNQDEEEELEEAGAMVRTSRNSR